MNLMWWYYFVWNWYEPTKSRIISKQTFCNKQENKENIINLKCIYVYQCVESQKKQNLAKSDCKDQSYFQTSMSNQTKFISIKKRFHMKLWVKYHFSSLRNSTTVVTLAFCILDRFSSILHNKISKDQTKL